MARRKLSNQEAHLIRVRYAANKRLTVEELAEEYKVSSRTIYDAIKMKGAYRIGARNE